MTKSTRPTGKLMSCSAPKAQDNTTRSWTRGRKSNVVDAEGPVQLVTRREKVPWVLGGERNSKGF